MGPVLSSLVNLQTVECELRVAQQKLKRTKQTVARQEQQIARLQEALAAKKEEIKLTRVQYHRLEVDLKSREDDVAKLRVALNTARTNKDYSAILTRINTQKVDKSKLEDQILNLMTQIEVEQTACREIEKSLAQEQARLAEVKAQADAQIQQLAADVARLDALHRQAAAHVPPKERDLFLRLAERYEGEVLAGITQLNGKRSEQTCGGCFMKVTLESVNALMTRDDMVTCPNCGRILMLADDLKQVTT